MGNVTAWCRAVLSRIVGRGRTPQAVQYTPVRLSLLADTVEEGIEYFTGRYEDVESSRAPGWYIGWCRCSWTTSGREPIVEDEIYDHVAENHVKS